MARQFAPAFRPIEMIAHRLARSLGVFAANRAQDIAMMMF
jgi:hypothetical protein